MSQDEELLRVQRGPRLGASPGGVGLITIEVTTDCPADDFLTRCREVMVGVVQGGPDLDDLEAWRQRLPSWFIEACAPERTAAEAEAWLERWRHLSPAERAAAELAEAWELPNWLWWFRPEERCWYW